jgi:regulator of protease activity HflC (stomatin/prohibitin superfamily)
MFLISIALLVAIVASIALYFVSLVNHDRNSNQHVTTYPLRKLAMLPYLLVVAVIAFESFTIVPPGHVGVQVTLGKTNLDNVLPEGVTFVNPISSVRNVNVQLQRAELENQNAGTTDMQQVHTDIVVNYRLTANMVPTIYKEFGLNVADKVLGPAISEAFKTVTGQYTSQELISKREEVSAKILERLAHKVAPFDITVSNISLVNFGFSKIYQDSIDAKMVATQTKLKAEQDLQRIEIEAKSRIAQAEGEAKAISIQAQAIQSNGGAQYVQLQWIEKWNGALPSTVVGADSKTLMNIGK